MKRSTFVWTVLALAMVALLVTACTQPANPTQQNTSEPTAFPTFPPDMVGTAPTMPTAPVTGDNGSTKPTVQPVQPTQVAVTTPKQPTTAPVATTAPQAQPTTAPVATTAPQAQPTAAATTTSGAGGVVEYTVKPGDNLFRIALAYGLSWQTVAAYNGITNPNAIYVGQVIKIPTGGTTTTPPATGKTYVVQAGDNLFRIALAYGLSYQYVAQYNGIPWPYTVYPGQVIKIP